jgi:hypothetical protein
MHRFSIITCVHRLMAWLHLKVLLQECLKALKQVAADCNSGRGCSHGPVAVVSGQSKAGFVKGCLVVSIDYYRVAEYFLADRVGKHYHLFPHICRFHDFQQPGLQVVKLAVD